MQESPKSDHGYTFLSETPETSRGPSMSNDIPAASSTTSSAPLPRNVNPPPVYVAVAAASQIVSDYYKSQLQRRFGEEVASACPDDATLFSDGALTMVNAFLDYLLYQFLATSRSTTLQSLRPAVQEVLKPKLAREALASAEEELQELLAGGEDDDEQSAFRDGYEQGDDWDLGMVWKRTRLRIMVYIRLGEMEDEDEERYVEQEQLFGPGGPERRFSSTSGPVSWAAAIFLTSVIEYLAEQTLLVAGHAAYNRAVWKKMGKAQTIAPSAGRLGERVVVEEFDAEKIALNSTLGRLWRTWRKRLRSPVLRSLSPSSRVPTYRASTSNLRSSRLSAATTEGSVYSRKTRSRQSSLAGNSEIGTVEQQGYGRNTDRIDSKSGDPVDRSNISRGTSGGQQKAGSIKRAQSHAAFPSSSDEGMSSASRKSVTSKTSATDPRSQFRNSGRNRSNSLPSPAKTAIATRSEQHMNDVATATTPNTKTGERLYSSQRRHLKLNPHQGLAAATVASYSGSGGAHEDRSSFRAEREKRKSGLSTADATADEEEPEVLDSVRVALESPGTPTEVVQTISRTPSNARSFPLRPTSPTNPSENGGLARYRNSSGYTGRSSTSSDGYILRPSSSPRPGSSQSEYFEKHALATGARERQAEVSKTPSRLSHIEVPIRSESGPADQVAFLSPSRSGGAASPDGSLASRALSSSARRASELSPVEEIVSVGSNPAALPTFHSDGRTILQSPLAASFSTNALIEQPAIPLPTDSSPSYDTSSGNTEIGVEACATESFVSSAGPTARTVDEGDASTANGLITDEGKTYLSYGPSEHESVHIPTRTTDVGGAVLYSPNSDSQTNGLSASHDTSKMRGMEALLTGDSSRRPNKEVTSQQQKGPRTEVTRHDRPNPPEPPVAVNGLASSKTPVSRDAQPSLLGQSNPPTAASTGAWPWSKTPPPREPITQTAVGAAREPTTRAESMRDFADFIRTTGPDRGHIITPLSKRSLPSLKGSTSTGAVSLLERRRPSGQSVRSQKAQRSGSPDKLPPMPSVRRKHQPRDPTPTDGGSADLIEFIRRGPPEASRPSHLPEQNGTVQTTKNTEELNTALSGRPSTSLARTTDAHSVSSTRESPLLDGSSKASGNSRTVLLPSRSDLGVTQPAYASPSSNALAISDPHEPVRIRRRIKDPYAIDTDDEDEDFLTALPKSRADRQEESLMDFLRDVDPPSAGVNAQSRSINNGTVSHSQTEANGASPADADPQSRSDYIPASRPTTAATTDSVETVRQAHGAFITTISSAPGPPQGAGNEQWSKSVASMTSKPRYLARSAGARDARAARNGAVTTAELAEFFRTSEPPSMKRAPAPEVRSKRDSRSVKSGRSSVTMRRKFWKKKQYLDTE